MLESKSLDQRERAVGRIHQQTFRYKVHHKKLSLLQHFIDELEVRRLSGNEKCDS